MTYDRHTPEQIHEHELFLLSRENRPHQDDLKLCTVDALLRTPEQIAIETCDRAKFEAFEAYEANSGLLEAEQAIKFPVFHQRSSDRHGNAVTALWRVLLFGFAIGAISTLVFWMVTR